MWSDKLGGKVSDSLSCNVSDCARNLSGGAEGSGRVQEAFRISTGPLYGQSLRSEESHEGFLHPCAGQRSRPFPRLWGWAGAPPSGTAGCRESGQLWATAHPPVRCCTCCTVALSKEYLEVDNPPANHQRYLYSKLFTGKI